MTPFQSSLRGSVPALLTTLSTSHAVDPEAMRKTARRLLENGSGGLVVFLFADHVRISPVPVMLYNIPSMTKVAVDPATIPRLRDVGVQGVKDSSGMPANAFAVIFRSLHEFLPAAGKAVLSRLGLMEKWVAPPKTPLPEDEADRAFEAVKSFLPEFESQ